MNRHADPAHDDPRVLVRLETARRLLSDWLAPRVGNLDLALERCRWRLSTGPRLHERESLVDGLFRLVRAASALDDAPGLREVLRECVEVLSKTLRPHFATALIEVDVEGDLVRRYADRSGLSVTNGGVRLHRARVAVRRRLRAALGAWPPVSKSRATNRAKSMRRRKED